MSRINRMLHQCAVDAALDSGETSQVIPIAKRPVLKPKYIPGSDVERLRRGRFALMRHIARDAIGVVSIDDFKSSFPDRWVLICERALVDPGNLPSREEAEAYLERLRAREVDY